MSGQGKTLQQLASKQPKVFKAEEYFAHELFAMEKLMSSSYSSYEIPASEKSSDPRAVEAEDSFWMANRLSDENLFKAAPTENFCLQINASDTWAGRLFLLDSISLLCGE